MQFRCTNSTVHLFQPLSNTPVNVSSQYSFNYQVLYIIILANSSAGLIMPRVCQMWSSRLRSILFSCHHSSQSVSAILSFQKCLFQCPTANPALSRRKVNPNSYSSRFFLQLGWRIILSSHLKQHCQAKAPPLQQLYESQ